NPRQPWPFFEPGPADGVGDVPDGAVATAAVSAALALSECVAVYPAPAPAASAVTATPATTSGRRQRRPSLYASIAQRSTSKLRGTLCYPQSCAHRCAQACPRNGRVQVCGCRSGGLTAASASVGCVP